jgi:hypothetical protein
LNRKPSPVIGNLKTSKPFSANLCQFREIADNAKDFVEGGHFTKGYFAARIFHATKFI